MIQRYSPFIDEMGGDDLTPAASMYKHLQGAWVKYEDHIKSIRSLESPPRPEPVAFVPQQDAQGCGIACLAMATGMTYEAVRATLTGWSGQYWLTETFIPIWLAKRGYWTRRLYGEQTKRQHRAIVNVGAHWVVVDGDCVHDPARGSGRALSEYSVHQWIEVLAPCIPHPSVPPQRGDRGPADLAAAVRDRWASVVTALEGIGVVFDDAEVQKVRDTLTRFIHPSAAEGAR